MYLCRFINFVHFHFAAVDGFVFVTAIIIAIIIGKFPNNAVFFMGSPLTKKTSLLKQCLKKGDQQLNDFKLSIPTW